MASAIPQDPPGGAAGTPSGSPPPPPKGFKFSDTPGWQGYLQWNLNVTLIAFSTLFIFLRLGTRAFLVKALGLDDAVGFLAYGVLVSFSALEIRAVSFGSGAHMEHVPPFFIPKFFSAFTTQHLIYFWAVGITRLAIVAFLLRMSSDKLYRRLVYAVAVFIVCQTISCFLVRLLECKDIKDLWLPPGSGDCMSKDDEAIMMWTHAAAGIAVDVALFSLPIWIVQKKMIFSAKMVRVILIFCVGLFAAITGIVRLAIMVQTNFAENTTFKMTSIAFWTDLEGHVGLWVACFPALQPLVRIAAFRLGLRTSLDSSGRSGPTGPSSSRTPHSVSKSGYLRSRNEIDDYDGNSSKSSGAIVSPSTYEMDGIGRDYGLEIRRDIEFEVYSSRMDTADDEEALRRGQEQGLGLRDRLTERPWIHWSDISIKHGEN